MEIAVNKNTSGLPLIEQDEYVFVVDVHGILQVFSDIKTKLLSKPDCFLTVLYVPQNSSTHSLFKDELEYLEKRFRSRFSLIVASLNDEQTFDSKHLEVIINSSIVKEQYFIVSGEQDFADLVLNQLLFLSINIDRIKIQIINSKYEV